MLKKHFIGFDLWGLILFLIIMLPNFIWFLAPAPNDILRAASRTTALDTLASVFQVFMVIALCIVVNQEQKKLRITRYMIPVVCCCLLYFVSWVVYYMGITNAVVILGLTVCPCLAFLFFAIERKNRIAVIPILLFTVCHLIYGLVNYVI